MADHGFGEIPHDGFSLHVEVPHHFVAPPAPNEAYDVVVYAQTEEGHGACCLKGSCIDVMMRESQMGSREEFYGGLEVGRDFSWGNLYPVASADLNRARGVSAGASCCLRCITRLLKAFLGHKRGSPVAPWPISPPCMPFF